MRKQLCYKDEARPSLLRLIPATVEFVLALFCVIYYISIQGADEVSADPDGIRKLRIRLIIAIILLLVLILKNLLILRKRFMKRNAVLKERAAFKSAGEKHKGHIVDTEMTDSKEFKKVLFLSFPVKVRNYYAVTEYEAGGEKATFKTPALNANPKYLSTKELNVYTLGGEQYASDFGYIEKPEKNVRDLFWWTEGENKR